MLLQESDKSLLRFARACRDHVGPGVAIGAGRCKASHQVQAPVHIMAQIRTTHTHREGSDVMACELASICPHVEQHLKSPRLPKELKSACEHRHRPLYDDDVPLWGDECVGLAHDKQRRHLGARLTDHVGEFLVSRQESTHQNGELGHRHILSSGVHTQDQRSISIGISQPAMAGSRQMAQSEIHARLNREYWHASLHGFREPQSTNRPHQCCLLPKLLTIGRRLSLLD